MRNQENLTAQKAVQVLQMRYPEKWKVTLQQAVNTLEDTRKRLVLGDAQEDFMEAYEHCKKAEGSNVLALLAASQVLIRKYWLQAEHIRLEIEDANLEGDFKRLDTLKLTEIDKLALRKYYTNTQKIDVVVQELMFIGNALAAPARNTAKYQPPFIGNWGSGKTP